MYRDVGKNRIGRHLPFVVCYNLRPSETRVNITNEVPAKVFLEKKAPHVIFHFSLVKKQQWGGKSRSGFPQSHILHL